MTTKIKKVKEIEKIFKKREILIIKVYPAASFASAILRSNHVKLTF